jgi:hypothetical protein
MGTLLAVAGSVSSLSAQSRVNDRDVESMMHNLRDDSKSFQPMFDNALKSSVIRKTSREKEGRTLAASFAKQTNGMLNTFKKTRKADLTLPPVLSTAAQIQEVIDVAQLNGSVITKWEKVKTELQQVSSSFGMNDPLAEESGPLGPGAEDASVSLSPGRRTGAFGATGSEMPAGFAGNSCAMQRTELMLSDHS